mmetsp:Transcript_117120/g.203908  ORF Transcript_117120/g.203908 Transcript_117120/m.203908 type:complete len:111 (-) Transcript_117120:215-547(-)
MIEISCVCRLAVRTLFLCYRVVLFARGFGVLLQTGACSVFRACSLSLSDSGFLPTHTATTWEVNPVSVQALPPAPPVYGACTPVGMVWFEDMSRCHDRHDILHLPSWFSK